MLLPIVYLTAHEVESLQGSPNGVSYPALFRSCVVFFPSFCFQNFNQQAKLLKRPTRFLPRNPTASPSSRETAKNKAGPRKRRSIISISCRCSRDGGEKANGKVFTSSATVAAAVEISQILGKCSPLRFAICGKNIGKKSGESGFLSFAILLPRVLSMFYHHPLRCTQCSCESAH